MRAPELFKPYDFGFEEIGNTNQSINIEAAARIAQAIFEKFWVENNCDICHFKSEIKRIGSVKFKVKGIVKGKPMPYPEGDGA